MLFKYLNQKNPQYKELRIRKMELLYKGGEDLQENLNLFIHPEPQENQLNYQARLKCAGYRNHLAHHINDFASALFSKSLSIVPAADANDETTPGDDLDFENAEYYREFAANADLCGKTLTEVLKELFIESSSVGRAYLGVDFPKTNQIPENRLEEEQSGADKAYIYCVPCLSVIDWEMDENGNYKYIILRNDIVRRESLTDIRDKKTIQFKVWEKIDGQVKYTVYEIVTKINKEPKPDDDVKEIESGFVSFPEIPILSLEMPTSMYIGGIIGQPVIEHLKRYSALIWAQFRALFEIPVYKQGPELPANGDINEIQSNPNRGMQTAALMRMKGFAVIGSEDDISFAGPNGTAFELIDQQLKDLTEAICQLINQMTNSVAAQSSNANRSGISKAYDHKSKETQLCAYASLIKKFAVRLYNLISTARKEDIIWQALGMADYHSIDKAELLQEATSLNLINIPSKTWKKLHLQKVAFELTDDLTPETQLTIKQEIDESLEQMNGDLLYAMLPGAKEQQDKEFQKDQQKQPLKAKSSKDTGTAQKSSTPVNKEGNKEMEHSQTGDHIEWQVVWDSIKDDYKPQDMEWIKYVAWVGPVSVPLESVDLSLSDQWQASKPGKDGEEKVKEFADLLTEKGWWKPVILLNTPHNDEKMQVIDGRHRVLAAQSLGIPLLAYVGSVGSLDKSTPYMQFHSQQINNKS